MPPKHKSGNFKQKNKPFKGGSGKSSKKKTFKIEETTKKIKKVEKPLKKPDRKNKNEQAKEKKAIEPKEELAQQITSLPYDEMKKTVLKDLVKASKPPKIVAFMPFNASADTQKIKSQIEQTFKQKAQTAGINDPNQITHVFPYFNLQTTPNQFSELSKENYIFIACDRDFQSCLDFAKIADIICPVLSCKDCVIDGLIKDPHSNSRAFDDEGYKLLTSLRIQGISKMAGIIQDLEVIPAAKQSLVRKFFQRYFASELGNDDKHVVFEQNENGVRTLMRCLQGMTPNPLEWREKRGYMLIEKLSVNQMQTSKVEVFGYLKGSAINANQLFHLTGYGDYAISRIDVLKNPFEENRSSMADGDGVYLSQSPETLKKVELFAENSSNKIVEEKKIMNENEGMMIEESLDKKEEEVKKEGIEEEEEKIEHDDQSDVSYEENETNVKNMEEEKKKLKFELQKRSKDELEFEDEVDYPADILCKDRFKKYKGLKNFKTSEWKKTDGLPVDYEKIFIYDDYVKTMKNAHQEAKLNAFAFPGFYVRIVIENVDFNILSKHPNTKPLILSSNFNHEGKISLVHFKVKKWVESEDLQLKSKEPYHFEAGFRRFQGYPIFSKTFTGCDKSKFDKIFKANAQYMISLYSYTMFTPCNLLLFKNIENRNVLVGSGELLKVDPYQIILKRIVLTGYPSKINRRRGVIHMMFFNPSDVKYFKPIELSTKLGLRGNIIESVGTHGSMKCGFSSYIKGNDTICLNLYRRVFPKFKFIN